VRADRDHFQRGADPRGLLVALQPLDPLPIEALPLPLPPR
jgi:hypothetical protein